MRKDYFGTDESCYPVNQFVSNDYSVGIGMDRGYAQSEDLTRNDEYKELHDQLKKAFEM